ncbi:polysaccharide pyruvyl transferase family protein [Croceicoccus sp. F390]|uniref:Polysaccharide pyruvyl transferase family protein n=1 Tax=Croceicoccus esteveae TaxID=3075597 RepID=A0ABU2ZKW9_9SPHN|nr:polysaccharide pyruvyl transferase family protein [Croceicoccus sp. F390]MDT0576979.1 polysaccharide pyruvyl transferase family protein [Croceicoccus sp. F390]
MTDMRERLIGGALVWARLHAARDLRNGKGAKAALIIPPAAAGSVGDAAMINATCAALRERGFAHIALASPGGWEALSDIDEWLDLNAWFFGQSRRVLARGVRRLGAFSRSVLIGADCIDGVYNPGSITRRLTLLHEHAGIGGETTVLGSSFGLHPDPVAVERLRSLHRDIVICARDPVSYNRLATATGRPIRQTADLAFLIKSDLGHDAARVALAFIERQAKTGRRTIGLNINFLIEAAHPGFAAAHRRLVDRLLASEHALLLVPHDNRGKTTDASLLDMAIAHLTPAQREHVAMLPPSPPCATKAVLGRLDAIVTSRMHAAILALSTGTAAISFVYQGKFEGLYRLLGLENTGWLLDPAELVHDSVATTDRICALIADAHQSDRIIAAGVAKARALADDNFAS